ncbi:MAG: hypothetical protein JWN75_1199 [Candidatus Saccharibacteria bacterium]|nr:hypothetical protein [Candidatus Saccharibacteria bacterium]
MSNGKVTRYVPTAEERMRGNNAEAQAKRRQSRLLKDAILEAAEKVGMDGEGQDGLVGYLMFLAKVQPKSFAPLLARVMPLQIAGGSTGALTMIDENMTPREAAEAYAATLQAIPGMAEPDFEIDLNNDEYEVSDE